MIAILRRTISGYANLKWVLPACLGLAIGLTAIACGGGESFTAEPFGTIAFSSNRDGNLEIYLTNPDGSEQRNITDNEADDSEPAWSPDGSRIAFSSFREGPANVFVMNADGSDVKQLTDHPAVEGGARWSTDGARIAFYSFRDQSQGLLWVMNADGSDNTSVLAEQSPSPQTDCSGGFPGGWFPDSGRILFRGSRGGEVDALQICSADLDGSDIEVIHSEDKVFSHFPSLSPDGRKIAFTSDRDGNSEIYVINAGGGGLHRLTDDPGLDEYPTWSPDGQWIAFHSDRDGTFDIYIMRPDGTDVRRVTDSASTDQQPSWSPQ